MKKKEISLKNKIFVMENAWSLNVFITVPLHVYIYIYIYIYIMGSVVKKISIATHVMQRESNELNTR